MNVICVDDEQLILGLVVSMCEEMEEIDEVKGFTSSIEALKYAVHYGADLAVVDIDMPDMSGLVLAERLMERLPAIKIIFVTGYSEFAIEAFAIHASGYLMKPVEKAKLHDEIRFAMDLKNTQKQTPHIRVKTFGYFEVFVDGETVSFSRSKAKELLAFLVDRRGATVSRREAYAALYENEDYTRDMQKQFDVVVRSLKQTLSDYGISEVFEMNSGKLRIVPECFECDLFDFLDGDVDAWKSWCGEYMGSYAWGYLTEGYISLKTGKVPDISEEEEE
ncbi:MAG: response regulator [Lachnospiraceae bacterium]|nr:response regulator [Lachnospiraceae bacterium]